MGYFKRSLAQSMTLIPSWARRPLVLIPFVGAFYFAAPMYKAAITASREVVQQEVDALSIELQAATDLTVDRSPFVCVFVRRVPHSISHLSLFPSMRRSRPRAFLPFPSQLNQ